jgi:hypothetical protein
MVERMPGMTAADVRDLLRRAVSKAGGLRAWARNNGVSAPYVSDVLKDQRAPGPAICDALGIKREISEWTYRKVKP